MVGDKVDAWLLIEMEKKAVEFNESEWIELDLRFKLAMIVFVW